MSTATAPILDIGRTLDDGPFTGMQKMVVLMAALAIVLDGFDGQFIGFAIPLIIKEWGASKEAFGVPVAAGLIGMARTWALELAPAGITVNVVSPGPIQDTAMFRDVIPAGSDRETALAKAIPVGRLGLSDDVARAVMFFADPKNSFVTGQVLYVCGGSSIASISI